VTVGSVASCSFAFDSVSLWFPVGISAAAASMKSCGASLVPAYLCGDLLVSVLVAKPLADSGDEEL
jgi:integral membrane sensor domain MASE1